MLVLYYVCTSPRAPKFSEPKAMSSKNMVWVLICVFGVFLSQGLLEAKRGQATQAPWFLDT